MLRFFVPLCLVLAISAAVSAGSPAVAQVAPAAPIRLETGVAVGPVVRSGRRPLMTDPVQEMLVRGTWQPPKAGDKVKLPDNTERTYETLKVDKDGWFESELLVGGGYLYASVESPVERIVLLAASGHQGVYVNGELRAGDGYSYGNLRLPVKLRKGTNHFLFLVGRGRLKADLLPITSPVMINPADATLPDMREDKNDVLWAAVPVINASEKALTGQKLEATVGGKTTVTDLPPLPPLTVRKVGFRIVSSAPLTGEIPLRVSIGSETATLSLRVRKVGQTYRQTFISDIDGTVQYFGVNPAQKPSTKNLLVLSLHGASVEAIGQADAYGPKDDVTLVAPTNRRPFGFDWEDWGRLDALEVLNIAEHTFLHDPARVVLTGHSMGGHGTWSVGSLFPERFAAIGPSAGWISFATYGGGTARTATPSPIVSLLERAANVHDTLLFAGNLLQEQVYIVHGDADDNVPVAQARQMRDELAKMGHAPIGYHEQPGANHWWDASDAPGADCVDWKPMFEMFQAARLTVPSSFTFTTPSPSVSASCHWLVIEQQEKMQLPSSVTTQYSKEKQTIYVVSENVAGLMILPSKLPDKGIAKTVVLDGREFELNNKPAFFRCQAKFWTPEKRGVSEREKSPTRSGLFKNAFQNRFVLVYPTVGTPEENAWGYARARYDAETFLYRGNGSPEMVADKDYNNRTMRDRNVILYGNATTNKVWNTLLAGCPITLERGKLRMGETEKTGDDVACVFVYPKTGSSKALVGVVGGTGLIGQRLTDRLPYFVSGAAFPDVLILDPTVLLKGNDGVQGVAYFGNDWGLTMGEVAWR